ncbi:hypothetical protein ANN_11911 [Periplaneta americana]|uniref:Uncharacterized protein n=1 Tax=Periplaneta americana TaxID=6978 RepID=A0ABQ8T6D4_PERAM|nr:hypothetical protein ANN_11911 [Periplaneta americana]
MFARPLKSSRPLVMDTTTGDDEAPKDPGVQQTHYQSFSEKDFEEKNRRVRGLVIVLARGRRHVKKLSVRETSEQRQRNYHLPETIPQRKHVLQPSTA